MNSRRFKIGNPDSIKKCPKCGNNSEFTARSDYCAEDCCNIWIECQCGYDPTEENPSGRLEDVWGVLDVENISMAVDCWNEEIEAMKPDNCNQDCNQMSKTKGI
jgi:hypothetical protein